MVSRAMEAVLSAPQSGDVRRLRCHWKHECLSVRMAVAAARHHSSGREGGGGRDVRRATATEASTPGDAASQPG